MTDEFQFRIKDGERWYTFDEFIEWMKAMGAPEVVGWHQDYDEVE